MITRSQVVARIADRTAWQHLWGSRDVIGLVTICNFYWWSFRTKPVPLTVSDILNVECNAVVDVTLIRPLIKGQGHSFWNQSILTYDFL